MTLPRFVPTMLQFHDILICHMEIIFALSYALWFIIYLRIFYNDAAVVDLLLQCCNFITIAYYYSRKILLITMIAHDKPQCTTQCKEIFNMTLYCTIVVTVLRL